MRAKDMLGRFGEETAVRYLRSLGMVVLERNWRCRHGEIDVVARSGPTLVFCEVKTRRGTRYGGLTEVLTPAKLRRLQALVGVWLAEHPTERAARVRIDLVALAVRGETVTELRHLRGVSP
ncbi:MAG: YraN family protein [Streptosporangiales bacterium]|nr:YraN family protein [Streptosporangiales bacterium]